jgi:hypothetical protein
LDFLVSPPLGSDARRADRRARVLLFVCWLALATWLTATHVFWRDEVRAFSLALSGSSYTEMLRNVHGEGHPALWYLILRAGHDVFPYREVLPVAGAVIGIAAMAILTFCSPFRIALVGIVLFSFYGAFEYVAMARNYGISALVMFALAALYPRVKDNLWFGVLLALLCNTNVPSCALAAAFLLFRLVEILTDGSHPARRDWFLFGGNAALAALGAYLCFITVYPTFNDQAVSRNLTHVGIASIFRGLADPEIGFSHLIFGGVGPVPVDALLLAISCLAFIRKPAALAASVTALVMLKLFFYFVYFSYYRHEILYVVFLLSLFWIILNGGGGNWRHERWHDRAQFVGTAVFLALLVVQTGRVINPIQMQMTGVPFSRSADVGKLLERPELSGAIVMGDPDTMLEPLAYYSDHPIWFLRQQRFGHVVHLAGSARHRLSLGDILADAEHLHRETGRPVVFLSAAKLQDRRVKDYPVMFFDRTVQRPDEVRKFLASTRLLARLRPSAGDEEYDVYLYPR